MQAALGVANMLPGFFTVGGGINEYMKAKPELAKCSNCGKSFLEIRKDGRLGCATCYSDFSSKLKPIIEGIYGSVAHKGRYPKSMAEKYKKLMGAREITELKILLDKAVQAEEYERAAEIRDSIRSLEKNTDKEAR
ncbi:MAG: UvrB/UvrC motif-containing protein [Oscillospiraceae bacterium]|nr:UvrB/UvrC motif-containing protein [Oscillospiraceae bacterium]